MNYFTNVSLIKIWYPFNFCMSDLKFSIRNKNTHSTFFFQWIHIFQVTHCTTSAGLATGSMFPWCPRNSPATRWPLSRRTPSTTSISRPTTSTAGGRRATSLRSRQKKKARREIINTILLLWFTQIMFEYGFDKFGLIFKYL